MNSVLKNKPQGLLACSACRAVPGCVRIPAGIVSLQSKAARDGGCSEGCTVLSRNGDESLCYFVIQQFASRR